VAGEVDVLYQTRIQKERFEDLRDYEKAKGEGAGRGWHCL
jgi:aspartate carbamoyltransferase catalytic subunit